MPCCCAYGCSNRSDINQGFRDKTDSSQKRTTYHKFPSNPERQRQWLVNIRRENFVPTKYSALCSDHFEEWCFDRTGSIVRIRETAVPTIFSFSSKCKNPRKRALSVGGSLPKKLILDIKTEKSSDDYTCESEENTAQKKAVQSSHFHVKQEQLFEEEISTGLGSDGVISYADLKEERISLRNEDSTPEENSDSVISSPNASDIQAINSSSAIIEEGSPGRGIDTKSKNKGSAKDKIIYLPDNRTYFEFATPKKKVILQLKPPKSEVSELKTQSLGDLISSLRYRQLISGDIQALLEAFGEFPEELERITTEDQKFSKELTHQVEKFASVLFTFSPKAFDLVSSVFRLPEKNALQARLKVSGYWPGFTQESLSLLKKKIPKTPSDRICSVMLDFISIRKQHCYDSCHGRWIGHIEFGGGQDPCDSDEIPLASEIFIFTVVGLGSNWKLPFGYFLTGGLAGEELQSLVLEAILVLEKCGLSVRALVCDGTARTVKMGKLLGCHIHTKLLKEITTSFPHPSNPQQKIQLVFGFHHAFTLLKYLLADKGSLRSSIYGIIKWKFFKALFGGDGRTNMVVSGPEKPYSSEYHHLQRMIRMCNPGFSYTVSRALELDGNIGSDEYAGSRAAANFCADLYRAFDLLNSRNPVSRDKPPLSPTFKAEQLESMSIIGQRLFDLELLSGIPVAEGGRWMSVVLLAFTLKSVAKLASVLLNEKAVTYLTTYRLNMDHSSQILECLQKRGSWDSTPTAAEFKVGYRKLLVESQTASCSVIYNNDLEGEDLTVGQGICRFYRDYFPVYKLQDSLALCTAYTADLDYKMATTVTAKLVIRHISHRLSCAECINLMLSDETSTIDIYPSNFILEILQTSERQIKMLLLESDPMIRGELLVLHIFCEYATHSARLQSSGIDHLNQDPHHVVSLIKVVIRTFLKFRLEHFRHLSRIKRILCKT